MDFPLVPLTIMVKNNNGHSINVPFNKDLEPSLTYTQNPPQMTPNSRNFIDYA